MNKLDIIYFIKVPPVNFGGLMESKRGDPYKMYNIKFVQPGSNFAQFSRINKQASNQNLKSLTQITKNRGNSPVSRRFGKVFFSDYRALEGATASK